MTFPYLQELAADADQTSKDMIAVQADRMEELKKISDLMKLPDASALRELLGRQLEYHIRKLVDSNNMEDLADVRAMLRLIDLLNTGDKLDSIQKWVEEKIKELEK